MQKKAKIVGVYLIFIFILIYFSLPSLWLFLSVFNAHAEAFIEIPKKPTLINFVKIFKDYNFSTYLFNSILVSTLTMILVTLTASLAGYSLSRWHSKYKNHLLYSILLLRTIPASATMVPIYSLMRTLHLRNSYLGLILIYSAAQLPFLIWLIEQFFDTIPPEMEEAAWIDGSSYFRTLFSIVMPIAKPGIAVTAILSFRAAWSESVLVLVLIDSQRLQTIPRAFYEAARTMGGSAVEYQYEIVATMGLFFVLPLMIIFWITRKYFVKGMLGGAIK
mgnify:CR=1 FL=1